MPRTYPTSAEMRKEGGSIRGLPPVAGGPLPAREGVDLILHWPGLSLAAAVRARALALVASAAVARFADHGSILSGIHLLAGGSFPDAKNNAQCSLARHSVVRKTRAK